MITPMMLLESLPPSPSHPTNAPERLRAMPPPRLPRNFLGGQHSPGACPVRQLGSLEREGQLLPLPDPGPWTPDPGSGRLRALRPARSTSVPQPSDDRGTGTAPGRGLWPVARGGQGTGLGHGPLTGRPTGPTGVCITVYALVLASLARLIKVKQT